MYHASDRVEQSVNFRSQRGFGLVELLVSSTLGILLLGGAMILVRQGLAVNSMLGQKAEMQQNARVSMKLLSRDLSLAGTDLPMGAIQLPTGDSAADNMFGCSFAECYVANNVYGNDRLHGVNPGNGLGQVVGGQATDMVTVAFRDPATDLDAETLTSIAANGTSITFATSLAAQVGRLSAGDVLLICNANGCAAATVTGTSGTTIQLNSGDPLGFNQPGATSGSVANLADPANPGVYPPSRAFQMSIVTYYLDATTLELMRQVNAHPAVAVAENVEDLQFSYDIFDSTTSSASAALADAAGRPNDIRKANVQVRFAAQQRAIFESDLQRTSYTTSVSTRNLTFRDRYQ